MGWEVGSQVGGLGWLPELLISSLLSQQWGPASMTPSALHTSISDLLPAPVAGSSKQLTGQFISSTS